MKKIAFSALALFSLAVQAKELTSFADISDAIGQGAKLTFVLNSINCTAEVPLSPFVASYSPEAALIIGGNRITASYRHFTLDDPDGSWYANIRKY